MKTRIVFYCLLIFSSQLWGQNSKGPVRTSSIPVLINWVDQLSGDFSFTKIWSYREGIYQNEYGQISCDGFCPPEIEAMKDSTGRIYEDSLQAFYEIIDTTHQFHSIQSEAWCYEYNGTDFMEVNRLDNDSFHCFTLTGISTHCSLNMDIQGDICLATIELNSTNQAGNFIFYCTKGKISIDKNLRKEGILKAVFSFYFDHQENPKEPVYWKGKIFAKMN